MKIPEIITHLTDTDAYTINMSRVYFYRFSDVVGEMKFICRTPNIEFTPEMVEEIRKQVGYLCKLQYTDDELNFVRSISYHKDAVGFLEFLRFFKFNEKFIEIKQGGPCGLEIRAKGPMWTICALEVHVLSIVNEVYFRMKYYQNYDDLFVNLLYRLRTKAEEFSKRPFSITEFGTRRRFSKEAQSYVIKTMKDTMGSYLAGTSNVYFAMQNGLKPMGTFAHQYVCTPQGLDDCAPRNSQRYAWDQWCREYRGNLGIALTDTLGQRKFEVDFDRYWANMFTGLRHDSGDPFEWGERAIKIYEGFDIDPRTKTLMFSDSLDFDKAWAIEERFKGRIKTAFGIGTFLTCDTKVPPLNIVMKLQKINGKPVAKLSNVPSKTVCEDEEYVERLKKEIVQ